MIVGLRAVEGELSELSELSMIFPFAYLLETELRKLIFLLRRAPSSRDRAMEA